MLTAVLVIAVFNLQNVAPDTAVLINLFHIQHYDRTIDIGKHCSHLDIFFQRLITVNIFNYLNIHIANIC